MARLVPILFAVALGMLPQLALAQPRSSAWSTRERSVPVRSFDIGNQQESGRGERDTGARIIAGTTLMSNGTFGVGFFGRRDAGASPSRVTGRELNIPKQRRAAIGFSLKF